MWAASVFAGGFRRGVGGAAAGWGWCEGILPPHPDVFGAILVHADAEGVLGRRVVGWGDDDEPDEGVVVVPVAVLEAQRAVKGGGSVCAVVVADDEDLGNHVMVAPREAREIVNCVC